MFRSILLNMPLRFLLAAMCIWLALSFIIVGPSAAQTASSETMARWAVHNPANEKGPDYDQLDIFLANFGQKRRSGTTFAYEAMRKSDKDFLLQYAQFLQGLPVSQLNKDQQLAYWLNLHNTYALLEAANAYPLRRVKELVTSDEHAWQRKDLVVEGETLSLSDIGNEILARHWDNQNVIYGLYLPARGGPAVTPRAFRASTVHKELEKIGSRFVNSSKSVDADGRSIEVSELYRLNSAVFDGQDKKVIAHLKRLAKSRLAGKLEEAESIDDYFFNWKLNEHRIRQSSPGGNLSRGGGGFGS